MASKDRHGSERVVLITLGPSSNVGFASLANCMELDFVGRKITLKGDLSTDDVRGFAGLWLREDGPGGPVAFDNMHQRALNGNTGWHTFSVTLPVKSVATSVAFGALLVGKGKVRVSALQILVDGKRIWEAPKKLKSVTAVETDHQFDGGSGIAISKLSKTQIGNLATLGEVWGFLKYHDPRVTAGRYQWDYELFRVMPKLLAASDREDADTVLAGWIKSLGPVPRCHPCAPLGQINQQADSDLAWLDDQYLLGKPLTEELRNILANRNIGSQFYVTLNPGVGNPVFLHELSYPEIRLPDSGFQLLALYRFWNVVEYWYPYRNAMGENWSNVLVEFLPRLALARTRKAYELALFQLIAEVHDTHANLWSSLSIRPPVGKCTIPVRLTFIRRQPVVTKLLTRVEPEALWPQPGDVLTRLDGVPVTKLISEWSPYYGDSNGSARLRDIASEMTRGKCGDVELGIWRDGRLLSLPVKRINVPPGLRAAARWDVLPGPTFRLLSPKVAYLKLSSAKADEAAEYINRAKGTTGLIIDLRDYPAQYMVFALGAHLVNRPTPFVRFSRADLDDPGVFVWAETISLTPAPPNYQGKVVILVNQLTQSGAEYAALAFRSVPNAIVVGSTTAGADGNVSRIPLPGDLWTLISGIGVFYPDGQPTQRIGIVPDVTIDPTAGGIRAGRDQVLEEAMRLILRSKTPLS